METRKSVKISHQKFQSYGKTKQKDNLTLNKIILKYYFPQLKPYFIGNGIVWYRIRSLAAIAPADPSSLLPFSLERTAFAHVEKHPMK